MKKYIKNIKYFFADLIGMFFAYLSSILIGIYLDPLNYTIITKTFINLFFNALAFVFFYLLSYYLLHVREYIEEKNNMKYDFKELIVGFSKSMVVNYLIKGTGLYLVIKNQLFPIWMVPLIIFPPAELLGYYIRQRHNYKKGFFTLYFKD
ncbi:MAG: hypothetical protein ACLFPL_02535 [Candidatus Nanoarchaeia archaeon]